jgi:hypothetical protein
MGTNRDETEMNGGDDKSARWGGSDGLTPITDEIIQQR